MADDWLARTGLPKAGRNQLMRIIGALGARNTAFVWAGNRTSRQVVPIWKEHLLIGSGQSAWQVSQTLNCIDTSGIIRGRDWSQPDPLMSCLEASHTPVWMMFSASQSHAGPRYSVAWYLNIAKHRAKISNSLRRVLSGADPLLHTLLSLGTQSTNEIAGAVSNQPAIGARVLTSRSI